MTGNMDKPDFKPIVELFHVKMLQTEKENIERWKITISDGTYIMSGVCSEDLSPKFHREEIKRGSIIALKSFAITTMKDGTKICVLYDVDIISIGDPLPHQRGPLRDVNKIWKSED